MNCVHMRLKREIKIWACYEGLVPVFTSGCHGALIHPTPSPADVPYRLTGAAAWPPGPPPPPFLSRPVYRSDSDPAGLFPLPSVSVKRKPASANHSSVSESTPRTHRQYDPSPGLQGAAPPLLIVLKTERYQDLISPGLPLAGGTHVHSV